MNQDNNNLGNNSPKMIGFDPITGQPIFDNGIGSRVEAKEEPKVEKKVMSKGKFVFHIFLSFGLWNLITLFIFKILMNGLIYKINNAVALLIIFNVLWIGASVLQILLTYWFNKFNTPQEYQLRSAKNTNLIMFLILIIFINKETIARFFDINTLLSILMGVFLVIHMIVIWFVNEKLFDKYWGSDSF